MFSPAIRKCRLENIYLFVAFAGIIGTSSEVIEVTRGRGLKVDSSSQKNQRKCENTGEKFRANNGKKWKNPFKKVEDDWSCMVRMIVTKWFTI
jgi:hypothetical protein